jgi:hypothetical protein
MNTKRWEIDLSGKAKLRLYFKKSHIIHFYILQAGDIILLLLDMPFPHNIDDQKKFAKKYPSR